MRQYFCRDGYENISKEKQDDTCREEIWIYVSSSHMCPVKHLIHYLKQVNIHKNSSEYFFRALLKGKKSWLCKKNKPISSTTICESLLQFIEAVGLNWNDQSLFSFRAEGVSSAANIGIPYMLLKRHGRRGYNKTTDSYIEDNLEVLLSVSKNLLKLSHPYS